MAKNKFMEVVENAKRYKKSWTKDQLTLKIFNEAGELSEAVLEGSSEDVIREIGDVILACLALASRYEKDPQVIIDAVLRKLKQ